MVLGYGPPQAGGVEIAKDKNRDTKKITWAINTEQSTKRSNFNYEKDQ